MSAIEPNWTSLFVFVPAWLVACAGLIHLSGSLPPSAAPEAARSGYGTTLIWLTLGILILLTVATIAYAIQEFKLTTIIIASGFVFLFSPFAVQDLPAALNQTRFGNLVLFCVATFGLILVGLSI